VTYYVYAPGHGLVPQEIFRVGNPYGEYRAFHFDHRGNTIAMTCESAGLGDLASYYVYGEIEDRPHTTDTIFLFAGKYGVQTDDNGLFYMRARYYNPELGRFINEDPIRDGLNWYEYAGGNPVRFIDPLGLFAWNEDDDHWFDLKAEVEKVGGRIRYQQDRFMGSWVVDVYGVTVTFSGNSDGVKSFARSYGKPFVRADVFYSSVVRAAGGEMVFLGGHPAFDGWFFAMGSLHTYAMMFVSSESVHWNARYFENNEKWGLQYATLGGTASQATDMRLQIVANVASDLEFDKRTFQKHLFTGKGAIDKLLEAHNSQGRGWVYGSLLVPGVRGIHISNNILSGLLHVAGIHPGKLEHLAIGWDYPTPDSFFGR